MQAEGGDGGQWQWSGGSDGDVVKKRIDRWRGSRR